MLSFKHNKGYDLSGPSNELINPLKDLLAHPQVKFQIFTIRKLMIKI